jgi:hypothetical protein
MKTTQNIRTIFDTKISYITQAICGRIFLFACLVRQAVHLATTLNLATYFIV